MELSLKNDRITVAIRPDLGGRIEQITDLETGRDWLWHPEGYRGETRTLPVGANFDQNWSGGWDEVFPNDAAGEFQGRTIPDHGELWSQPWAVNFASSTTAVLSYSCCTVPVRIEKTVVVEDGNLKLRYLIENTSDSVVPFLLKLHAAVVTDPGDEILLPPCYIEPVDTGFGTIIGRPGKTLFPSAYSKEGREVFVNRVPGLEAAEQEFFYATELIESRCGVRSKVTSGTFSMHFSPQDMKSVWVFGSYGKWHGHRVLILEPCTDADYDMTRAYENGTCALLRAKERREMFVDARLEAASTPATRTLGSVPVEVSKGAITVTGRG